MMELLIIKMHVLDEASRHHANEWWWVKADGTDIVESVRGVWNGDVDLNDGSLQHQYEKYQQCVEAIQSLKLTNCSDHK